MDEALRVRRVRYVQTYLTHRRELVETTMEHIGRCEQRQTRVLVMMVVPVKEFTTPRARMLHVTEAPGETRGNRAGT